MASKPNTEPTKPFIWPMMEILHCKANLASCRLHILYTPSGTGNSHQTAFSLQSSMEHKFCKQYFIGILKSSSRTLDVLRIRCSDKL